MNSEEHHAVSRIRMPSRKCRPSTNSTTRLTEIYRQSAESRIVLNAHRINRGEGPLYGDDFLLVREDKQQNILDKITEIALKMPRGTVQVLTPVKKGILGNANLNASLQQVFNPPEEGKAQLEFGSKVFRVGDRVMQIKNDYRLEYKSGRRRRGGRLLPQVH